MRLLPPDPQANPQSDMAFRFNPVHRTSELKSVARIIFGFMLFRHGMEQVLGFPPAYREAAAMSFLGVLKLMAFPGGLLMMLGLLTRPVALVFSVGYLAYWLVEPFVEFLQGELALFGRPSLFGAGGAPSDPLLLTTFFFLYLFMAGPGVWSLDRLLNRDLDVPADPRWASYSLAALRIVAGFLFIFHGLEKVFGRFPLDPISTRALAASIECVGGPMLMLGLFSRPVAFLLSGEMAFAYFMNHWPERFWGSFVEPNQEAAILNCFLFLFLWAVGPGVLSLDGLWKRRAVRPGS